MTVREPLGLRKEPWSWGQEAPVFVSGLLPTLCVLGKLISSLWGCVQWERHRASMSSNKHSLTQAFIHSLTDFIPSVSHLRIEAYGACPLRQDAGNLE